ncbi:hypothetical protein C8R44DRAFT_775738 [Mycena epipterygia]|nr:hypothetical protein C8R44DRAFT_775738 [Mycena epipterygia]
MGRGPRCVLSYTSFYPVLAVLRAVHTTICTLSSPRLIYLYHFHLSSASSLHPVPLFYPFIYFFSFFAREGITRSGSEMFAASGGVRARRCGEMRRM